MAIRVLDQHTAELIAAGEVVERPSSVIKELVENSIDASAKSIFVEIEKGGLSFIRVQDDGSGIAAEDIPTAFLRHATSKVKTKEDLDNISTLGFRGEALASIASVAQVQVITKTKLDEFASMYLIAGGKEEGLQPAARPVGTTMEIRNIFYNTPARMKFLKKDSSEGGFVTETVSRLALSHPEISFKYIRDGKRIFNTPGDGELKSAAYNVLGADFARDLASVNSSAKNGFYTVHGLVTPPRAGRASRSMQFFFVNGRFVKNRTMMAALEQAYRNMMMVGSFPGCILFLRMPVGLVDVNVHPAKTEVRFANEKDVFGAVYSSVKASLLAGTQLHQSFTFNATKENRRPEPPVVHINEQIGKNPSVSHTEKLKISSSMPNIQNNSSYHIGHSTSDSFGKIKSYNEVVETLASDASTVPYTTTKDIYLPAEKVDENNESTMSISVGSLFSQTDKYYSSDKLKNNSYTENEQIVVEEFKQGIPELKILGEVFKTYVLCQRGESICFIDKHAAHERVLYENLVKNRTLPAVQQLLQPVAVNLSAEEKNALLQNGDILVSIGLEVDDFGGSSVLVRGIPADIVPANIDDWVQEVAQRMSKNAKDAASAKTEWVLHSVACRAAIKAGDTSASRDMLCLAEDVLTGKIPPFCPHGRPVVLEITRKELEKQFGRLG